MAKLKDPDPPSPTDPAASPPSATEAVNPAVQGLLDMVQRQGQAMSEEAPPPFSEAPEGPAPQFPTVERQWPFLYVFDPNRWDVIGGHVVPVLYKLKGAPGVNGVQRTPDGKSTSTALATPDIARRGHKIIPADVDGPRTSYLRRWQVGWLKDKKTGHVEPMYSWHDRFETLFQGSPDIASDTAGYVRWLLSLIERGVLPPPSHNIYDRLEGDYAKRVGQYLQKDPQRADQHRKSLEAVRAARRGTTAPRVPAKADGPADPGLL